MKTENHVLKIELVGARQELQNINDEAEQRDQKNYDEGVNDATVFYKK